MKRWLDDVTDCKCRCHDDNNTLICELCNCHEGDDSWSWNGKHDEEFGGTVDGFANESQILRKAGSKVIYFIQEKNMFLSLEMVKKFLVYCQKRLH